MNIGNAMLNARQRCGYSRTGVYMRCGITEPTIFRIEHDKRANPSLNTLRLLAATYGVKLSDIIREAEDNE